MTRPTLPSILSATQIVNLMTVFDPQWAEALWTAPQRVALPPTNQRVGTSGWIPISVLGRRGFIRVESGDGVGEYRSQLDAGDSVLPIDVVEIKPAQPVTLARLLTVEIERVERDRDDRRPALPDVFYNLAKLEGCPNLLRPGAHLRGAMTELAAAQATPAQMRASTAAVIARTARALLSYEITGREAAVTQAVATLVINLVDLGAQEGARGKWSPSIIAVMLTASLALAPEKSPEAILESMLAWLSQNGGANVIFWTVRAFETQLGPMIEAAKDTVATPGASIDSEAERVHENFGYACALWAGFHQALRSVLPISYFSQFLARFLLERVSLPTKEREGMEIAFKQLDETTVVIFNSFAHAVRIQDARHRNGIMMRIGAARAKNGEAGARGVLRHLIEQQLFYPRAWRRWLLAASSGVG